MHVGFEAEGDLARQRRHVVLGPRRVGGEDRSGGGALSLDTTQLDVVDEPVVGGEGCLDHVTVCHQQSGLMQRLPFAAHLHVHVLQTFDRDGRSHDCAREVAPIALNLLRTHVGPRRRD
ncbi:ORF139 [Betabaculovirus altermyunipunctae]|uniref:ORF139 n=1 Tax=Betabaculovirus altermyunipunctae TaxID=3051996 RepID=A0A1S5YE33_9BBAC|nr:ORF139 [Betabaculovirus altermyunipunctae]AQQ80423.1 ORF139 [Betabaculovirus altermyunipunctae]